MIKARHHRAQGVIERQAATSLSGFVDQFYYKKFARLNHNITGRWNALCQKCTLSFGLLASRQWHRQPSPCSIWIWCRTTRVEQIQIRQCVPMRSVVLACIQCNRLLASSVQPTGEVLTGNLPVWADDKDIVRRQLLKHWRLR